MFWKKKKYPPFWLAYDSNFKRKQSQDISKNRFVVFDTETTGLNPKKDVILSIGCIAIENLVIKVLDQYEVYIKQTHFSKDTIKIHGLLKEGRQEKIEEKEALKHLLNYIKNAVIVAHHAAFDVAMINEALKRQGCPKLKNTVLDTGHLFNKTGLINSKKHFNLDELALKFNIPLHDRHTASGDAYITALLFLKLLKILNKKQLNLKLNYLLSPIKRIGLL